jgi:hypothetical protein
MREVTGLLLLLGLAACTGPEARHAWLVSVCEAKGWSCAEAAR